MPSTPFAAPRISCAMSRSTLATTRSSRWSGATAPAAPRLSRASPAFCRCARARSVFNGRDITALPPHRRARFGIGYAPENSGIFPELTVAENLMISRWLSGNRARRHGARRCRGAALTVFPEVGKFLERPGLNLSGGQKKMVSIARAMALAPSLMILDEAFEGLAPVVVKRFREAVLMIKGIGHLAAARRIEPHQRGGDRRPPLCDRSRRDHLPGLPARGPGERECHADVARVTAKCIRLFGSHGLQ